MKQNPLVSVIIPVYNVEEYLEQCVDSIVNQTYKHLEIILVNDGSKDKSPVMCEAYAARDARVKVLHKPNGGLISAWIAGVQKAQGEYLCFVDSDDWVEPNMIEELRKHTDSNDREIICSNYIIEKIEKSQSILVKQSMKPGIYSGEKLKKELFLQLLGNENRRIHASRCMKLISRKLILDNIQYTNKEITMGEDLNIMFSTILDADRVVVMEEGYFYHYRLVDASMAHKYNPRLHEKIQLLYQALRQIIEKKINNPEEKEEFVEGLKKEYIFLMFLVLKNELRGSGKHFIKKIQKILKETKKDENLGNITVEVTGKANRLLYFIWKKPNAFRVLIGRVAIKVFDRM